MSICTARSLVEFATGLILCANGMATEINVPPGDGTLAAAFVDAKAGDVIHLAAGDYRGSADVPAGVTLVGCGADETVLIGTGQTLLRVAGEKVTIRGLELRGCHQTENGVSCMAAVRIERCRFTHLAHGVAVVGTPLVDVVACEFQDCRIGVRAAGKSSPTVWGCRFSGGVGVFAMDGGPYICENLFYEMDEGVRIASDDRPVLRNNVFWRCKSHGVLVTRRSDSGAGRPAIRNCIFVACGDAVMGGRTSLSDLSDSIVYACGDVPIRVDSREPAFDLAERRIRVADPELRLGRDGTLTMTSAGFVTGQGIRTFSEPRGTKADIGLSKRCMRPGCVPLDPAVLPPVRFAAEPLIVNSVSEEHLLLDHAGCTLDSQELIAMNGHHVDVFHTTCGSQQVEWRFDVDRFYGEPGFGRRHE